MARVPFRSATGQTGLDAYTYEATAIANAQRELDERFHSLVNTVRREAPGLFTYSSDYYWAEASSAANFTEYVKENGRAMRPSTAA